MDRSWTLRFICIERLAKIAESEKKTVVNNAPNMGAARPTIGREELRMESGVPVPGLLVRAVRPSVADATAERPAAGAAATGAQHG